MLIAMAGLPGAGKSTVAQGLARALRCALLSVDPIEAAMWRSGVARTQPTGLAAYVVAEDLAREQLLLGNDAVVDAVNDVPEARGQWKALAADLDIPLAFVEIYCSEPETHRLRLQERRRGIAGFPEPSWESVLDRKVDFDTWSDPRLRLDSMQHLAENIATALDHLEVVRGGDRCFAADGPAS
jgi:predicted kinase